jgi:pSer/pThr/pTyr-binding forkhead associated (FHA) protein
MADVPVLVCTTGELAGRMIPVPEGGIGIGRSPENAVVIHDEGVSRYHGRLLFENGSLWLQDAGSRNGVFVNGARVTGHKALKVGDFITIAQHTFELRWQDEELSADAPVEPVGPAPDEPGGRRRWYWPFS